MDPKSQQDKLKEVMIDADLAELYEVSTKRLNEQVRRNRKRFPEDFMFRLTKTEAEALRSQFATSKPARDGMTSQFAISKKEEADAVHYLMPVFGMPTMASTTPTVDSKYRVFCANTKIEVEQRTLEQQKDARGSNVCMLGEFDYLSDADKHAEKLGGKGADCKCP